MANITKKDLVTRISNNTGLTQVDTKIVIEAFLNEITDSLGKGKNIEIRNFARFKIRKRKERIARNPRTGEEVIVKEGYNLRFEASRKLKEMVDSKSRL